ncbi:MAG TPA: hypothetical protein PKH77_06525 [Anaerolineae bacterium]|nr:hypothetical protein [Anaerolineae bacterium]
MQEIAPGILVETAYPPYNVALIAADHMAVAIDWPLRPSHAQQWLRAAQSAVGPLRYVILTDAGPERQVAAAQCGLSLIASTATRDVMMAHDEHSWRELLQEVAAQCPEEALDIHKLTPPHIMLTFDRVLRLYRRAAVLHLEAAPGAAPGALWAALPEHKLLFAGDSVALSEPPPLGGVPDFLAWLEALTQLENRPQVYQVVPGRGTASILKGEVERQCEFLRTLRHTARRLAHSKGGQSYMQPAQDLGQMFFNQGGHRAVQRIRRGLERLVAEFQATAADKIPASGT